MHTCRNCNVEVTERFVKASGRTYFRSYCKSCAKLLRVKTTTNYNLENNLLRQYGISVREYIEKLQSQDYECAICGDHAEPKHEQLRYRRLHVDHSRKTGEVRGLLCFRCNLMIGFARESKLNLTRAITYLSRWT